MFMARITDRTHGVCSAHSPPLSTGGTITAGSGTCLEQGLLIARLTDEVTADCGHKSVIISASPTTISEGLPVARLGDNVGGGPYSATIISASTITDVD